LFEFGNIKAADVLTRVPVGTSSCQLCFSTEK